MAENKLEFTIGLATGEFLSKLGESTGRLKEFIGSALGIEGVRSAFERTFGAIERGAALAQLARQTGESVSGIYQLQQAFRATGLDADAVGTALFHLQHALGGVSDSGQPTGHIFNQLGLNLQQLQRLDAATQLQTIAKSFDRLNAAGKAAAAGEIFGRENARNFLVLASNMQDFNEALRASSGGAAMAERTAAAFHAIEISFTQLKAKVGSLWTGVAEGLAPLIQQITTMLNKIDFAGLATKIGKTLGGAIAFLEEAFKEGKAWELFKLGATAAAEFVGSFFFELFGSSAYWKAVWDNMVGEFKIAVATMAKMFLSLGDALTAGINFALDKLWESLGGTRLGKLLGLQGYVAPSSFSEVYEAQRKESGPAHDMVNALFDSGAERLKKGMGEGLMAYKAAAERASSGPAQEAFAAAVKAIAAKTKIPELEKLKTGAPGEGAPLSAPYHRDFTALEKMGFVTGGSIAIDYAAQTARNSGQMAATLTRIESKMGGPGTSQGSLTNSHA